MGLSQMIDFETERDCALPSLLPINGGKLRVWMQNLITFTDTRFLRSVAGFDGATASSSDGTNGCQLTLTEDDLAAAELLFGMMEGLAPERLALSEIKSLLALCSYCMADKLVQGLADYLAPLCGIIDDSNVSCYGMIAQYIAMHVLHTSVTCVTACTVPCYGKVVSPWVQRTLLRQCLAAPVAA